MKNSSKKIVKSSIYIMIVVLLGKVLGFIKQMVIAWKFGTSSSIDVYFTADSFTLMFAQIILLSVPPAIVTIFLKLKGNHKEESNFVSSTFVFLTIIGIVLSVFICIVSLPLSNILGISYTSLQKDTLSKYIIYLCPAIIFACVSGVSSGVLQSKNKFLQDKMLGIFLSMSIILFIFALEEKLKVNSLILGFVFGYFIYTLMMVIMLTKNIKIRLINPFQNETFKKFLRILIPLLIGTTIVDISHLIDKIIASSLESGSVSALYYAQIICSDLVNSVIISTIGVVLLPKLTIDVEKKSKQEVINTIRKVLKITIPIIALIALLYIFEGKYLVKIVFERGQFNQESTIIVSNCVIGYSIGLIFMLTKEILSRYFYAINDTFSPMISNIIGIITNIILSIVLSNLLGVQGIAYATSISIVLSNIILLLLLKKNICTVKLFDKGFIIELSKLTLIISVTCIIGLYVSTVSLGYSINNLILIAISIITVYTILCYILKIDLYHEINKTILKKMKWKEKES